jgi:hypothetical protein
MSNVMSFETGSILLASGSPMPPSLVLQADSFLNGWGVVENSGARVEQQMLDAGWTFFFMAGELRATAFGFDDTRTLSRALSRLAALVRTLGCNSFEVAQISQRSFFGGSQVSVSGHARHLQEGHLMFSE